MVHKNLVESEAEIAISKDDETIQGIVAESTYSGDNSLFYIC